MPIIDVYQERKKKEVMQDTWGHLAPVKTKRYYGFIIFTLGEYRDYCCIKSDFKNLESSPWYYEDLNEFMYQQSLKKPTGYMQDLFDMIQTNYTAEITISVGPGKDFETLQNAIDYLNGKQSIVASKDENKGKRKRRLKRKRR